jgi:NADPH:quinone reductase-like Zn-dependent oxidoreductase
MKSILASCMAALALVAAPIGAHALGKNEKGCLVGGAAGGVGGKLLGDHPILGAAAGCAVGTVVAKNKSKKEQTADKQKRSDTARNSSRPQRREPPPAS